MIHLSRPSGKDDKLLDTEDSSTGDTSTSNVSDVIKHVESPSKQLVQDLLEENTKLTAEKDELSVRYRDFPVSKICDAI